MNMNQSQNKSGMNIEEREDLIELPSRNFKFFLWVIRNKNPNNSLPSTNPKWVTCSYVIKSMFVVTSY